MSDVNAFEKPEEHATESDGTCNTFTKIKQGETLEVTRRLSVSNGSHTFQPGDLVTLDDSYFDPVGDLPWHCSYCTFADDAEVLVKTEDGTQLPIPLKFLSG